MLSEIHIAYASCMRVRVHASVPSLAEQLAYVIE